MVLWGQSKECIIFYSNPTSEGVTNRRSGFTSIMHVQRPVLL